MGNFYKDNEDLVYYDNIYDCFEKVLYHLKENTFNVIGNKGQQKAKKIANAKRVTSYMIELVMNQEFTHDYEWKHLIVGNN